MFLRPLFMNLEFAIDDDDNENVVLTSASTAKRKANEMQPALAPAPANPLLRQVSNDDSAFHRQWIALN